MVKIPEIVPVSDLRQDAAAVLKRLKNIQGPLVITQRGRARAVLISIDVYERTRQENELLRMLAAGEKEIMDSRGHSLDSVLREADALLKGDES
ncbi:MAG: type II toxin-antitoxin system Phd/YefM family antitoxin [Deltaproteobacteria bacterium]|nr:type II toxin-antitoxin system Phd/YefM family antitoxin [Deltaproteobacteria bacterium]